MSDHPKYELAIGSAKQMFVKIHDGDDSKWNRELVFAIQSIRANKVLQNCSQESIKNSVINIASIGISLNPALALAYLVPRGGACVLDISFRGLVKIATDSGSIIDIDATVVREKDFFEYEMGLEPRLVHRPYLEGDPGKPLFVYSIAILHNRMKKFLVMNKIDIEKVKSTSKARSGPWTEWEGEMWKKTVVKRMYKLLPQTDRMSQAVSVINEHEGLDKSAPEAKSLMDRFAPVEEAEIVSATCEFCAMPDGKHEDRCPDNIEGMP